MSLVFTQLASDNFTPDANPLNPAHWTTGSDGFGPLKALSGFCVVTANNTDDLSRYTGVVFPSDQYAQIILSVSTNGDSGELVVRSDSTGDSFGDFLTWTDNGNGTLDITVINVSATVPHVLFSNVALPFSLGDVFKIAVFGTTVFVNQNGVLITQQTETVPIAGGAPALEMTAASSSSMKLSSFSAGSVTNFVPPPPLHYSEPDCRNYATFPNLSRNVNGTLTYDVSAHPSVTPPVDSRVSKPVPSGTYPQNSRAPGTFGPGE